MRADVLDDASELEEQERLGAMAKLVASQEPTHQILTEFIAKTAVKKSK